MNIFNLFRPKNRWLFYDIEVYENIGYHPDFKYVDGWDSKALMHITCIATYSSWDNAYRIHSTTSNSPNYFDDFQKLVKKATNVIGFNSVSFDDVVCAANGLKVKTDYDLLQQIWVAAGLPPVYTKGVTTAGYKLENLAQANLGVNDPPLTVPVQRGLERKPNIDQLTGKSKRYLGHLTLGCVPAPSSEVQH